ncbi:ABC transporter ATP-binding protein [Nocardioides dubius]|uniref:ABC transporter ATP-binding protein n=1 Tax=Nocardioides dubius TaxID=317019 RepID=UPI0039EAC210
MTSLKPSPVITDATGPSVSALAATGLTVRLGGRTVLDDVSITVGSGRVTGLLGPNGSGKSTLLQVLGGLRRPEVGVVLLDGDDVARLGTRRRARRIALVEQQAQAAAELTARQVVGLGRLPHRRGGWGTARDPQGGAVVATAMAQVRITHLADRLWSTLSGGERQRCHLARAIAQEPRVLLLDEPTNHLDLGQQLRFLTLVRQLPLTCVVALHDLELATAFCDDVVVLDAGRVMRAGPVRHALTPDLLADVYRVRAEVSAHPRLPRDHLAWDDFLETP